MVGLRTDARGRKVVIQNDTRYTESARNSLGGAIYKL